MVLFDRLSALLAGSTLFLAAVTAGLVWVTYRIAKVANQQLVATLKPLIVARHDPLAAGWFALGSPKAVLFTTERKIAVRLWIGNQGSGTATIRQIKALLDPGATDAVNPLRAPLTVPVGADRVEPVDFSPEAIESVHEFAIEIDCTDADGRLQPTTRLYLTMSDPLESGGSEPVWDVRGVAFLSEGRVVAHSGDRSDWGRWLPQARASSGRLGT